MSTKASDHPLLRGLAPGTTLTGAWFEETLVPNEDAGTIVLAENDGGVPCVTASTHGDGATVLIGSFLGMADHESPSPANRRFVLNMLEWAGIERPLTSSHDGETDRLVDLRLQRHDGGFLLFCINHGEQPEEARVDLRVPENAEYRIRSLLDGRILEGSGNGRNLRLTIALPARDVEVLAIEEVSSRVD